jgi:hypothetical protein
MRNKLMNSTIVENVHPLLENILMYYANELRSEYPELKIRNAVVFKSAILELARRGFIELVDARKCIPAHVSEDDAQRVKRMKHQPVWIPSPRWPDWSMDIHKLLRPYIRDDVVAWKYDPSVPRTSLRRVRQVIRAASKQGSGSSEIS